MRHAMENDLAARARRKRGSQFGLLYTVAFVVTLVPYTVAWAVPGYLERRAAAEQEQRAEDTARVTAQLERVTAQAHDALLHSQLDDALAAADRALAVESASERARAVKANALIERFWLQKSAPDLEQARQLVASLTAPTEAQTFAAMGNLALIDDDPAKAVALLTRAAELAPTDAYVQHQYGFALSQAKRPSEALTHFATAISIAPDMAWVQENLQDVLATLGRCEERIPQLKPETIAGCHNALGIRHYNAEGVAQARQSFARAVELAPGNGAYRANLAVALLRAG